MILLQNHFPWRVLIRYGCLALDAWLQFIGMNLKWLEGIQRVSNQYIPTVSYTLFLSHSLASSFIKTLRSSRWSFCKTYNSISRSCLHLLYMPHFTLTRVDLNKTTYHTRFPVWNGTLPHTHKHIIIICLTTYYYVIIQLMISIKGEHMMQHEQLYLWTDSSVYSTFNIKQLNSLLCNSVL